MRIRQIGKWTLATALVGSFAASAFQAQEQATALKAAGKEVPPRMDPKTVFPVMAGMAGAVVLIAAL